MPLIPIILRLMPIGWPEPLRKAAAWACLIVAALGLLWAAKAAYDASVIEDHEDAKALESVDARDAAADQRAADMVKHIFEAKEAEDAINSVPPADAQRALDCLRLARAHIYPAACGHYGGGGIEAPAD